MGFKDLLKQIPNDVSGDGKRFASALKKFLQMFSSEVDVQVKDIIAELGTAPEQVTGLKLTEEHTTDSNGMPQNNILVEYDNTNVADFASAQIWVKEADGEYQLFGNSGGVKYTITGVTTGKTYTVKVVAVNKHSNSAVFDGAPQVTITIKGSVLVPDVPKQFVLTWDEDGPLWEWLHEDNGYVDFFELRLDGKAGEYSDKLLDRTRAMYSRVNPGVRSGTAYLFVRNIFGTYSEPAVHQFSKSIANKPKTLVVESTLDGVVITMDPLPEGYKGWKLIVNGEDFKLYNRQFTYYQFSGEVTVKYCFFDDIGDGAWSDEVTAKVKTVLDKGELPEISVDDLPEIGYDEFDQSIKDAIDAANAQAGINKDLQDSIGGVRQDIENVRTEIDNAIDGVSDEIQKSVSEVQSDVDGIVADLNKDAVNSPFTSIKQNNEGITALAATVDEVDGKTQTNAAQIELNNQSISSLVLQVQEVDGKTQTNAANILQTAEQLESLVYEQVEELDGRIASNASKITQTSDEIKAIVDEKVEMLDGKIAANTSKISQTADEITSLVHSEIASSEEKITAETASKISQTSNEIKLLIDQEVEELDGKISSNTSAITQSANEIKALVNQEVKSLDGKISSNASAITQSANSIATLTTSVNSINGVVSEHAASIKQNTDSITAAVTKIDTVDANAKQNAASIELTNNSINSVVSSLNGTAEDSGYKALTGLASSIKQTNNSITSVVTELNKTPEDCSYSAITQLKGSIDLCVKDKDLNGEEIVTRINLSEGTVTIDGKYVHVTGDTIFDNNVIIGGYIAAGAIGVEHLKTNSVTAEKIVANTITGDKIAAKTIFAEKIADKTISSVKIEDGAITAIKIEDGAVKSTKIEGGAIHTEHIQAESIIGQHISAGAISADKLYAGDINMTGALALVGGAVRLDENGLKVSNTNGTYTLFDENGMAFYDSVGNRFAGIGRFVMGAAKHGNYVKFDAPWDVTPKVTLVPTNMQVTAEGFSASSVYWTIYPSEITTDGFRINCFSTLGAGSSGLVAYNTKFLDTDANSPSGEYSFTPIEKSTQATVSVRVVVVSYFYYHVVPGQYINGIWVNGSQTPYYDGYNKVTLQLYADSTLLTTYTLGTGGSKPADHLDEDIVVNLTGNYTAGQKLKVVVSATRGANDTTGTKSLKCTLVSATYNVTTDTVLTSGECMFIATDGGAAAYSVE